jgi:hypothetical protein
MFNNLIYISLAALIANFKTVILSIKIILAIAEKKRALYYYTNPYQYNLRLGQ